MTRPEFKKLVMESLKNLPRVFRRYLKDVEVVVADEPTPGQDAGRGKGITLGLYQGVPLSDRDHLYGMVLPDQITIFQRNIERVSRSEPEIKKTVQRTVRHEIAHHFGISDRRLREMGRY